MELYLKRIARRETYTIGRLMVDGRYLCDTLEDKDRGLRQGMSRLDVARLKVKGETAIPVGRYEVIYTYSPRFKRRLPLLLDVTGFDGVRIHAGNTERDTEGCLLVGENKVVGRVVNSRVTFDRLDGMMREAVQRGERIWMEIE